MIQERMLVFTEKNKSRYFLGKRRTLSADEDQFFFVGVGSDFEDIIFIFDLKNYIIKTMT
jgi:hypothetical protein